MMSEIKGTVSRDFRPHFFFYSKDIAWAPYEGFFFFFVCEDIRVQAQN